ncbi:MAG: SRPBCC family protein [Halosimplex sp.]
MPTLVLETEVDAPPQRVFDVARRVQSHADPLAGTDATLDGTANGRLELGDVLTWRTRRFGLPLEFTVQVTQLESPAHLRGKQVDGPLAELVHDHRFERTAAGGTRLVDECAFASPLGPLGSVADGLVLERRLEALLRRRNRALKSAAEGDSN